MDQLDKKAEEKNQNDHSGCPEVTPFKYHEQQSQRWSSLHNVLSRSSNKFAPSPFDVEEDNLLMLQEEFRVLVVGAGGLGCEILKNLALSGFKDIEIIDLDIIDLSNLNRQFLFRKKDIGKPKARIAAEFVMKRVPQCTIKWHQTEIQSFSESYYAKFNIVIAGLDNITARRWLNSVLCDLVKTNDDGTIDLNSVIPFIDGGTEGLLGQCRTFIPMLSSCFECSVGTITPQKGFPECTIAAIPRKPQHCIAYAKQLLWPKLKSITTANKYEFMPNHEKNENIIVLDTDDIDHMSWIYNRAMEWANKHNIEGVTFELTLSVVKNIIPAIASTNALISACCVNEAFKMLTWCSFGLNNYFMFMGKDGIYSRTWQFKKNEECLVCGSQAIQYKMDPNTKFVTLYHRIYHDKILKLKNPSVSRDTNGPLWMSGKALRHIYKGNLEKAIKDLFFDDTLLKITDKNALGKRAAKIRIKFEKGTIYNAVNDGCSRDLCPFQKLIKF